MVDTQNESQKKKSELDGNYIGKSILISLIVVAIMASLITFGNGLVEKYAQKAHASGEDLHNIEESATQPLMEYIEEVLPGYLEANEFDMSLQYTLSNAYEIWNSCDSSNKLYFVFCNDTCVGEFIVSENALTSSFMREQCDIITTLYQQEIPIGIIAVNPNCTCIVQNDSNDAICIYGVKNETLNYEVIFGRYSKITLQRYLKIFQETSAEEAEDDLTRESNYISVPIIPNAEVPESPIGICWIASSLSVLKYNNKFTSYTTTGFFYYYLANYPILQYGTPDGTRPCVCRCFSLGNLSYGGGNSGLSFASVKYLIDAGKPIVAGITPVIVPGVYGHVVVVCGYNKTTQSGATYYYYYKLMDPNCSNYVTCTAPASGTGITYNAGYTTYVNWNYCVY